MLLTGEYAIADSDEDLTEMFQCFRDDHDAKTLIVIDPYNRIENIKELRGVIDLDCFVVFLHPDQKHQDRRKGIYLIEQFDLATQDFLREHSSYLVFYN